MTAPVDSVDHFMIQADCGQLEVVIDKAQWLDAMPIDCMTVSLKKALRAIGEQFDEPLGFVSMSLSDNKRVAELNKQFRDKDQPTNVLSFPESDYRDKDRLGDIILALEICAQEAKRDEKPFSDHFLHLVIHGWLHLLGFNHKNDIEALEMEGLERAILASLDIPDPFDENKFTLDDTQ